MAQMPGGQTSEMDATEEVKQYCEQVKEEVLKKAGKDSFHIYEVLKYKSQCVAGTNYFAKVKVHPEGECIHVRIFKPLPCNGEKVELSKVQTGKNVGDEIGYF